MSNHYYNANDLNKFGNVGEWQKPLADKFFDYYTEKDQIMHSLGLFLNFVYTALAAVILGGFLFGIRLIFHVRKKEKPLRANFLLYPLWNIQLKYLYHLVDLYLIKNP